MRRVDQRDPAPVRPVRHVDDAGRVPRGRAPAPATRIRGATASPATHRTPPSATRRCRVAAGSPTWSAQTTSAPRPAAAVSRPSSAARAPSSRPAVGSSRTTTSGWPASAAARATRWRWPWESAASGRSSGAARAAATSSPASACPRTHASWRSHPLPGQPGDGGEALGRVAGAQPRGPRDAPARRHRDAGDEPQQRRLPHAVGALHGDDRARLQREVDVAQDRRSRAVALGDLCELDQNAPRRDSTAGTVLTRIERSRNTDQRSR